jgi:hypothetical protein
MYYAQKGFENVIAVKFTVNNKEHNGSPQPNGRRQTAQTAGQQAMVC